MKDNRILQSKSHQNEDLYEIINFNPSKRKVVADYYVLASRMSPTLSGNSALPNIRKPIKFQLMEAPLPNMMNVAIIIKKEIAREVFLRIDWETVYWNAMFFNHIKLPDIHRAFNEKLLELEWRDLLERAIVQERAK